LEVPSTDSAIFDHAPADGPRALSTNVNVDATVSSRLMGQRLFLSQFHRLRVAARPRGASPPS